MEPNIPVHLSTYLTHFAELLCGTIEDITGFPFTISKHKHNDDQLRFGSGLTAFIQFTGDAQGYYSINSSNITLSRLFENELTPYSSWGNKQYQSEVSDIFCEILNIAVGQSLPLVETEFGILSFVSAISSFGTIRFPMIRTFFVTIIGEPGKIECAFTLDLTTIKMAKRLRMQETLTRDMEQERNIATAETKAKSTFLANMSHDIRTPMNSIVAMADLLTETVLDDDQKEYVQLLVNSSNLLISLVNNILDFSKIESGEIDFESIPLNFSTIVQETAQILAVQANEKGISLSVDIAEDFMPYRFGDTTRIRQIILNLIGNAVKFTRWGGVTVTVKNDPDELSSAIYCSVADTGIGVAKDCFETIFNDFSQANSSVTREFGGTGLGLSIVRSFITRMGGTIWLESEIGKGTTFYFTLPLPMTSEQEYVNFTKNQNHSVQNELGLISPLSILVADDIPANYRVLELYFRGFGATLEHAHNGKEACELFYKNSYDLVLMDLLMPVMNGYDATEEIRKWEAKNNRKSVPIFALSAQVCDDNTAEYFEKGFTTYLSKPIKKVVLFERINTIFKNNVGMKIAYKTEGKPSGFSANVSNELKMLIPGLFEDIKEDIEEILSALSSDDFETLSMVAHGLKGASGNCELVQLADLFQKIEFEAKNGQDKKVINELLSNISAFMDTVQIQFI